MLNNLLKLFKKDYQTLNKIEVSKDNILHNYNYLSDLNGKVKIAPVVKSNGYGHGIANMAKILDPLKAPYLCVDSLYEAYELQKAGVKTKILILGYTNPENFKIKRLPFSFAVYDIETAKVLDEHQEGCGIHIFVDTGMHREGVSIEDLPDFLKSLKEFKNLKIEGLMSHLASSESRTDPIFQKQIIQFKKAQEICKKYGIEPQWLHIAATGSLINPQTRPLISEVSNMARAGLALYGFSSSTFDENLKPALKLTTKIIQIKKVAKGEKLGYDGTYTAKKDLTIAVLPIGYYDGVDRRLSNKGVFLVQGKSCPILGRVSMNINIIDVSNVPNAKVGDEVIVYSPDAEDKNSLTNSAKICRTIPYDLLVNLAESTRRVIV